MAESESNENWMGLSSWFTAAKDKIKNSEVLESVRKDLEEFGGAVSKGASSVISSTGSVIEKTLSLDSPDSTANTVKRSFSTFIDQVNTVFNPSPDDSDVEAIMIVDGSETVPMSKLQKIIYDIQKNEKTYTEDPDAHLTKQYKCWLEIIEDQLSEGRIQKYLKSSDVLRKQYETLVPNSVDKDTFWRRYLFKKAVIEDEIARQEIQEKKEMKEKELAEEKLKWENEELANEIELSEEQQIKLLEEYEKETKIKNSTPTKKNPSRNKGTEIKDKSLTKIDSSISLDTASSNSSIDDEWEKITEVEKQ